MNRKEKLVKKIMAALNEKAKLNNNPGPLEHKKFKWTSSKDRRHDGRKDARYAGAGMKYKEAHAEAIEPLEYWDDWSDYRDGFRYNKDGEDPAKIKKQIAIRRARKAKETIRQ